MPTQRQGFQSTTQVQVLVDAQRTGPANRTSSTSNSHAVSCCVVGPDSVSTDENHTSVAMCCSLQRMPAGKYSPSRKQIQQQGKTATHWQPTCHCKGSIRNLHYLSYAIVCTVHLYRTGSIYMHGPIRKSLSLGTQLAQAATAEHAIRSNL